MLELRDAKTITAALGAELMAIVRDITDWTEGAVARSLLEAVAVELQREDYAIYQGVREGIETGVYKSFAFTRLSPVPAGGTVRFSRASGGSVVSIPAGSRVRVPGTTARTYTVVADATLAVGELSIDVAVRCTTAGAAGNTPANTVVESLDVLLLQVTNPAPFLNGLEAESAEARRERFSAYIAGLSRATVVGVAAGARSVQLVDAAGVVTERVSGVLVREPFRDADPGPIGRIQVYIDNGGGTASAALIAAVRDVLVGTVSVSGVITPGYVAAGVDCTVYAVTAAPLDVTALVTVAQGYDESTVTAAVIAALLAYLQSLQVFQSAILAELIAAAMAVEGVADVSFVAPTTNVTTAYNARITPGVITVTAA